VGRAHEGWKAERQGKRKEGINTEYAEIAEFREKKGRVAAFV